MLESIMRMGTFAAPVLLLLSLASCGADTNPHPAYADPCSTPMAGVLSCSPGSINPPATTPADACRKLTTCGILAERNMVSSEPPAELTQLDSDPCDGTVRFTQDEAQSIIACIDVTGCSALGASFADKEKRGQPVDPKGAPDGAKFADNDSYVCKGSTTTIWTTTICDAGLLSYASHTPTP